MCLSGGKPSLLLTKHIAQRQQGCRLLRRAASFGTAAHSEVGNLGHLWALPSVSVLSLVWEGKQGFKAGQVPGVSDQLPCTPCTSHCRPCMGVRKQWGACSPEAARLHPRYLINLYVCRVSMCLCACCVPASRQRTWRTGATHCSMVFLRTLYRHHPSKGHRTSQVIAANQNFQTPMLRLAWYATWALDFPRRLFLTGLSECLQEHLHVVMLMAGPDCAG